ncbi:MAG: metal-dependent hydrolase [Acidobacteriota bacterium]
MDNLTHSLAGLAAAKAGLERLSPGTTALCILAANAPDADVVVLLFSDRWAFLKYHRGITHSIVGTLVLALLLPVIFHFLDRFIARLRGRQPTTRLKGLLVASVLVTATHPVMDWTNNYGVRLLLPWSSQWFYGDLVFIIDPFIWLVLGGAGFLLTSRSKWQIGLWLLPTLVVTYLVLIVSPERGVTNAFLLRAVWIVGLTALVISARLRVAERWEHRIAVAALALVVLYWGGLAFMHFLALRETRLAAAAIASQNGESVIDLAAMPTLANPFQWQSVVETERAAYRFDLSLLRSQRDFSSMVRYERADAAGSKAVATASKDWRARIFLGFARFPGLRVADPDCVTQTLVQFADLRYTEPGKSRGTFTLDVPVDCPNRSGEQAR